MGTDANGSLPHTLQGL